MGKPKTPREVVLRYSSALLFFRPQIAVISIVKFGKGNAHGVAIAYGPVNLESTEHV